MIVANEEEEPDFLDELMEEWTAKDPEFPKLVAEAAELRKRRLAAERKVGRSPVAARSKKAAT